MKKLFIFIPIVIVVIIGLIFIVNNQTNNYLIKVSIVDVKSPDRILTLYKDNKKVEFDSIYYLDDVFICDSTTPNVSKTAIKDIKNLKVKLKNGKIIKVKVEEEK